MDESQAFQILVIILSVALAIFLILAITATALIIKLLKSANRLSTKAEQVVDNIESASESFKKVAGPAAVLQALTKAFKR
jgi:hypothetical protein